jgi:hypothetical protein
MTFKVGDYVRGRYYDRNPDVFGIIRLTVDTGSPSIGRSGWEGPEKGFIIVVQFYGRDWPCAIDPYYDDTKLELISEMEYKLLTT